MGWPPDIDNLKKNKKHISDSKKVTEKNKLVQVRLFTV